MIYLILALVGVIVLVMLLKKFLHLRVDDEEYSDKDDYLERRIKKDEDDK